MDPLFDLSNDVILVTGASQGLGRRFARVLAEGTVGFRLLSLAPGGVQRGPASFASDAALVQDIWLEFRDAHNQNIRITGYPTEKNPALLARIIEAYEAYRSPMTRGTPEAGQS